MNSPKIDSFFRAMGSREQPLCLFLNRASERHAIAALFIVFSRLGDGYFWYGLIFLLPICFGSTGGFAAAHMTTVGLTGLAIYKILKPRLERPRPFTQCRDINLATAPLDVYSFPSGHTLHAVAFTIVAVHYYPALSPVLVPFTIAIALSRIVLGLHYPSDVLAGAAIGASLGYSSLFLMD